MFPSITSNSSHRQIDIFTKDEICTSFNIVIVDLTRVDLFLWSCVIQKFATFDVTQAKEKSYCNWHLIDQFLPIEIFECLHKQTNMLLHNCAHRASKGLRTRLF
jgi:hypothetical protein